MPIFYDCESKGWRKSLKDCNVVQYCTDENLFDLLTSPV